MRIFAATLSTGLVLALPALAQGEPKAAPSPGEIVATAPSSDWVTVAPSDLLVMTLAPDRDGKPRQVTIQLMPPPFSQGWVGNIRKLAAAHWWDGLSINRVQDNYVVQWGDANAEDKAKAKPLPAGLQTMAEGAYVNGRAGFLEKSGLAGGAALKDKLIPRNDISRFHAFFAGFPFEATATPDSVAAWPVHCYGMVGVGRGYSPDTGSGAELYTVIGHAPRHLDRNIALVGRVVEGVEHLSSLPRGTGPLGFYEKAEQRVPIVSIRLASELPKGEQPRFEYLSTESESFAKYADARANRRDPFFIVSAGGADICNIPVPVRRAE
jgi:cyclophilin family peptidyl-prolyl cis-trans isomerase